jgi:aspartyl-tRNA(Asn)/glutamyl-tRNA(Gln) amidotransferase subunit C
MHFSMDDMKRLARLSRLDLDDSQLSARQKDLESILGYVDRLEAVDVSGVSPMTHAVPMALYRRLDQALPGIGREGLKGSKGYEDGLVKVPKIIE